jgi:hypothetical protein
MTIPRWAVLILLPSAALLGCDDRDADETVAVVTSGHSGVTFSEELQRTGCEVLTTEMVSRAAGVDAAELQQLSMGGTCIYKWEGGEVSLMSLSVRDDARRAGEYFDAAYRTMTPEEAVEASAILQQQIDRQVQDGSLTREQAEMAGSLGGLAASAAATKKLDVVDGIGDRAVYDGTERTQDTGFMGRITSVESQLGVLLGNVVFDVQAHLSPPDQTMDEIRAGPSQEARQRNRELALDVGRAVVTRLLELR